MRVLTYTVPPEFHGRTVKFCLRHGLGLSDGAISRIRWQTEGVAVDGRFVPMVAAVRGGDVLAVPVGDLRKGGAFVPEAIPLEILFEDEDIIILNKPAGLAVHGRSEKGDATLGAALAARYGAETVFHPVNRLDKDTSGVMTVARSGYIHDRLRRMLHTPAFHREYLAVTVGAPGAGRVDAPLGKAGPGWKQGVCPDGKPAATVFETLKEHDGLALVRCVPETGRTHQIRVHMAYLGCPLAGDRLYGTADDRIGRHALHAWRAELTHPVTGARLEASAALPEDMRELVPWV